MINLIFIVKHLQRSHLARAGMKKPLWIFSISIRASGINSFQDLLILYPLPCTSIIRLLTPHRKFLLPYTYSLALAIKSSPAPLFACPAYIEKGPGFTRPPSFHYPVMLCCLLVI